jgi:Protein of unknown function (DUF433)
VHQHLGDVLSYLASGMSEQQILGDFPQLTRDDIRACMAFAACRDNYVRTAMAPFGVQNRRRSSACHVLNGRNKLDSRIAAGSLIDLKIVCRLNGRAGSRSELFPLQNMPEEVIFGSAQHTWNAGMSVQARAIAVSLAAGRSRSVTPPRSRVRTKPTVIFQSPNRATLAGQRHVVGLAVLNIVGLE